MIDMNKKYRTIDGDELIRLLYKGVADLDEQQDAADRIDELEAKLSKSEALLAKAVEAERVYCANVVKHFYDNGFFTKPDDNINRTTLAELKGQDDEG